MLVKSVEMQTTQPLRLTLLPVNATRNVTVAGMLTVLVMKIAVEKIVGAFVIVKHLQWSNVVLIEIPLLLIVLIYGPFLDVSMEVATMISVRPQHQL
jgi:hypothetical protein